MRSFFTKKRSLVALAAVAVLAIAGGAYAYFTSTGSTTATGSTGSVATSGAFTVADTSTPATLYPGTGSFAITGTITNSNPANLGLGTATVNITAPTNTGNAANPTLPTCTAADYALTAGSGSGWVISNGGDTATYSYAANNELNHGANTAFPTGLTVSMNDLAHNQDNCEGATVNWTDAVTS